MKYLRGISYEQHVKEILFDIIIIENHPELAPWIDSIVYGFILI
jgi:hypothetical protein